MEIFFYFAIYIECYTQIYYTHQFDSLCQYNPYYMYMCMMCLYFDMYQTHMEMISRLNYNKNQIRINYELVVVFSATFNYITVKSCTLIVLIEETK